MLFFVDLMLAQIARMVRLIGPALHYHDGRRRLPLHLDDGRAHINRLVHALVINVELWLSSTTVRDCDNLRNIISLMNINLGHMHAISQCCARRAGGQLTPLMLTITNQVYLLLISVLLRTAVYRGMYSDVSLWLMG